MEEVYLKDRGGIQPDATDVLSDELVNYLDGVNLTLGTEKDPRYNEYKDFLNSIAEASILTIEPDQMSTGKYDDLDLTGDDDVKSGIVEIPEVKDEEFIGSGFTWQKALALAMFNTPFNEESGMVIDKDYLPVLGYTFPDFTDA